MNQDQIGQSPRMEQVLDQISASEDYFNEDIKQKQ